MDTGIKTPIGMICISQSLPYPCTPAPGILCDSPQKIVTASTQVQWTTADGKKDSLAPSLYQNCMEPDSICIEPLTLEFLPDGTLHLSTWLASKTVPLTGTAFDISAWQAQFHSGSCTHCTNCGRCGW
ncbi:MAG: hypothetical protein LKF71_02460 [Oscillospiraceae bacterium]|jgi:hypothetical protein|nr:hypothetical protein [Oscillospiraceae bacterium]